MRGIQTQRLGQSWVVAAALVWSALVSASIASEQELEQSVFWRSFHESTPSRPRVSQVIADERRKGPTESTAWRKLPDVVGEIELIQPPGDGTSKEQVFSSNHGDDWDVLLEPSPPYGWHLTPQGLIYRDYLAGSKQSRMRSVFHEDVEEGSMWDITLGGHFGLLRNGSMGPGRPVGFQLDIEGSAQVRLDRDADEDLVSTDYRFGIPLSWGNEVCQTKFGYYHISSHVGDEYQDNNPGFSRLNFVRETLILGHSYYIDPRLRLYAEVGLAFLSDVSKPWEFQLGVDYAPACGTGLRGAPFGAINYHIRQELQYDGNVVIQFGWAWRQSPASGLIRFGIEYYYGRDEQFSFFSNSQHKLGLGIWYDY